MIETPVFASAAVAAPHRSASEAGRAVLAEGGNAIEAMVAMAATIAVVYPHMNAIGGDGFWLVHQPGGKVHAIEACGPAGSLATIERYHEKGYDAIPARGPDAALTVAGAVGGWQAALALSQTLGGRMPLKDLLADAIRHCTEGYAISASELRTLPQEVEAAKAAPGFSSFFWPDGEQPKPGARRRPETLGATLAQLADAGLDDFYRGDIGREIAADLSQIDAPITRADIEAFKARMAQPLSVKLPGLTAYNFPPPTQGLAALLILGIFEKLGVTRAEGFDHIHGLVEATKRAFAIRDRHVTDPAHLKVDPAGFLTEAVFAREAAAIDRKRAASWPFKAGKGDTVWMGAIDGSGLAVSYIQSIYWEYGSGCILPKTGLNWQNRGVSFSLDKAALNPLAPGRKPFHTLNPPLACFDDGRIVSYGAMGGDGQPQFQAQILSRYRFGQNPAAAVDAPRFLFGRSWGAGSLSLKLESRFDPELVARLTAAGHPVEEYGEAYSDQFGHAGMLVKHQKGHVEATHDPRSDGDARGI
ncbi:gamma-glutamyltransferase [Bosea caraganae]|uniref:Gamma-glutamyltransferase n=1 Tax=Bosea caraganae TaxID=2763117 RepID=A0A370LA58_9HYPH|nr:gamma-glutamyltransferase [Bosea caraganae]RDJ21777.1 gamma-glutamyltransferase [Bosea caraganae]RDJ28193.1 gamma-glutamyltransferase [Bosea caraganae]